MSMIRTRLALSATMAATVLVTACMGTASRSPLSILPPGTSARPVEYFGVTQGDASLTVRIVDRRTARDIQTLGDADAYNGVLLKLSNPTRLKSAMVSAAAKQSSTYSGAFTKLPSDSGGQYLLTVGLYRNVTSPASASDPAYASDANKVGQGSATFSLTPGENKTVLVTINAVGELTLTVGGSALSPTALTSAQSGVTINTQVNASKDPEADSLKVSVLDGSGAVQSSTTLLKAQWPASPATATASLMVPTLGSSVTSAGYTILVELLKGSTLLSRRSQAITVSAAPTPSPSPSVSTSPAGYSATFAGGGSVTTDGAAPLSVKMPGVQSLAIDSSGNVYYGCDDASEKRVRVIAKTSGSLFGTSVTAGQVYTLIGGGGSAFSNGADPKSVALGSTPIGVALDHAGNLYASDSYSAYMVPKTAGRYFGIDMLANRLYRIVGDGTINANYGSRGDNVVATAPALTMTTSMAFDASDNLFVTDDNGLHFVPRVAGTYFNRTMQANWIYRLSSGHANSVVVDGNGNATVASYLAGIQTYDRSTGGVASRTFSPSLSFYGLLLNSNGDLIAAGADDHKIYMMPKSGGTFFGVNLLANTMTRIAGTGTATFAGDGGLAVSASYNYPSAMAMDSLGTLYISEWGNGRIRTISP